MGAVTRLVRLLIVDDHPLIRRNLRLLTETAGGVEVIGEACDGSHAVELAVLLQPDVVMMDIRMPNMNGIEATRRIREEAPSVVVIGMSTDNSPTVAQAMARAGACAFIPKDADTEAMRSAIFTAFAAGGISVPGSPPIE